MTGRPKPPAKAIEASPAPAATCPDCSRGVRVWMTPDVGWRLFAHRVPGTRPPAQRRWCRGGGKIVELEVPA